MILITLKSPDKTFSKIEKNWFLKVHRVEKVTLMKKSRSSRLEVHWKTHVLETVFNRVTGLRTVTLL